MFTYEHIYIHEDDQRIAVLKALRPFGSRVPLNALWPLLGSNQTEICRLAFQHIQEVYPDALKALVPELQAIVDTTGELS